MFRRCFADRCADGATITVLQHEFGLAKSTVKLWEKGPTRARRCDRWTGGGTIAAPGSSSFASSKYTFSVARVTT